MWAAIHFSPVLGIRPRSNCARNWRSERTRSLRDDAQLPHPPGPLWEHSTVIHYRTDRFLYCGILSSMSSLLFAMRIKSVSFCPGDCTPLLYSQVFSRYYCQTNTILPFTVSTYQARRPQTYVQGRHQQGHSVCLQLTVVTGSSHQSEHTCSVQTRCTFFLFTGCPLHTYPKSERWWRRRPHLTSTPYPLDHACTLREPHHPPVLALPLGPNECSERGNMVGNASFSADSPPPQELTKDKKKDVHEK